MKSFKEFLYNSDTEYLQNFFGLNPDEYIFQHAGIWVIDTNHTLQRSKDRPTGQDKLQILLIQIIEWLKSKGRQSLKYLFLKKSTKQGVIVDYRPDKNGKVKGNQVILVTWLGNVEKSLKKPIDQVVTKDQKDVKVILERVLI